MFGWFALVCPPADQGGHFDMRKYEEINGRGKSCELNCCLNSSTYWILLASIWRALLPIHGSPGVLSWQDLRPSYRKHVRRHVHSFIPFHGLRIYLGQIHLTALHHGKKEVTSPP